MAVIVLVFDYQPFHIPLLNKWNKIEKEKVRRLIEQFENHPNRNMLLKDYKKSEEINHFSQDSKDLVTEMGNNEILEFYETSSKRDIAQIGSWFCMLHMRKMHAAIGKKSTVEQRQI